MCLIPPNGVARVHCAAFPFPACGLNVVVCAEDGRMYGCQELVPPGLRSTTDLSQCQTPPMCPLQYTDKELGATAGVCSSPGDPLESNCCLTALATLRKSAAIVIGSPSWACPGYQTGGQLLTLLGYTPPGSVSLPCGGDLSKTSSCGACKATLKATTARLVAARDASGSQQQRQLCINLLFFYLAGARSDDRALLLARCVFSTPELGALPSLRSPPAPGGARQKAAELTKASKMTAVSPGGALASNESSGTGGPPASSAGGGGNRAGSVPLVTVAGVVFGILNLGGLAIACSRWTRHGAKGSAPQRRPTIVRPILEGMGPEGFQDAVKFSDQATTSDCVPPHGSSTSTSLWSTTSLLSMVTNTRAPGVVNPAASSLASRDAASSHAKWGPNRAPVDDVLGSPSSARALALARLGSVGVRHGLVDSLMEKFQKSKDLQVSPKVSPRSPKEGSPRTPRHARIVLPHGPEHANEEHLSTPKQA
eukprot:jgi/Mesen1/10284/ME000079S09708